MHDFYKIPPIQICHAIKIKMTFQSRVHTSMVHPAVGMSITLLPHLFFSQVHGSACVRDSVGIGAVVI